MDWSTASTTRSRSGGETNTATGATGNWYPYWARGTPRTTPGAPWVQSASQGNGFLTVVWSHPANTGGVAITAYDLRYIPHDATDKADANWTVLDSVWAHQGNPFRQYRLEGLTNGVFYDVQMRAVNIGGASGWSNTKTGSPLTKSGAPSIDALAPGDGALTVAWTAPADNGGSSISAYSLRYIRGDAAYANWTLLERIWRSGSLEHTITGLINGVEYEVQVQARTRASAGEWSATARGTSWATPGAPAIDSLIAGRDRTLAVAWSAPADDGGGVTGYDLSYIQSNAPDKADANWTLLEGVWSSGSLGYDLAGLTNGVGYDVQMRAENPTGRSGWSATARGTPWTTPGAPAIDSLIAGSDRTLAVVWSAPADDGGAAVTGYDLRYIGTDALDKADPNWSLREGVWSSGVLRYDYLAGLTNGVEYDVQVRAVNAAGDGEWSATVSGTPGTTPGGPSTNSLTPGDAVLDAGSLAGFTLLDASDQSLPKNLTDDSTVRLEDPTGGSYSVRVDTESGVTIGSVELELTGPRDVSRTDNSDPYSLYGGGEDSLTGEPLPTGSYDLQATAYSEEDSGGDVLGTLAISFEVTGIVAQGQQDSRQNHAATGQPTISGTAQVGETLTADVSGIADADGRDNASFSYQWVREDGGTDTDIQGETSSTYTLIDSDEGKTVKVRVSFTDDAGNEETLTSATTAAVAARPNTPATGQPTIGGTAQVGETLTVNISDIDDQDDLENVTFSYQWQANDSDIPGATSSSYTVTDADLGKTVKVRVTFTDDAGNPETLTSGATDAVAEPPAEPLTATLENTPESHDGQTVFTFELRFSEDFGLSYVTLRDHAFTVTGGTVTGAGRLERPSNIRWEIHVQPDSESDVTVVLPITEDCNQQGAICTGDGEQLSNRLELTVSGPQSSDRTPRLPASPPSAGRPRWEKR